MHITVLDHARAVIFGDQRIAVIEEPRGGRCCSLIDFVQPPERIIDQIGIFRSMLWLIESFWIFSGAQNLMLVVRIIVD